MEAMNSRIPPAMKNDPGWMPRKRSSGPPVKMNTHSTTNAIRTALAIVGSFFARGIPVVSEMKTGTMPKGSTTMNTARKMVTISLAMDIGARPGASEEALTIRA